MATRAKRMTAAMWPEVLARSRWRSVGRSGEFPHERGVQTWGLACDDWVKCPECGIVPFGGSCPYCRRTAEPLFRLTAVPAGALMVLPGCDVPA
jgi:hypothetical protein